MGIERLWPLAFIVFVPVIVLLYLLKQKVKERRVPALNLWHEAYETMQAATPWEKFRHRLLMYLQILALLLMVAALLMPYLQRKGGTAERVILCIDCSGSMNGVYDGKHTKLEEAKEQASAYVNDLKAGTKVTLLSSGTVARLLATDSTDYGKVKAAIDSIEPSDIAGNLEAAVNMALPMAKQWEEYHMMGFTDSDVDIKTLDADIVDLSVSGTNVGMVWLNHQLSEQGAVTVQAGITNYGSENFSSDVELHLDEELYDVQTVTLKAGESQTVTFREVSAGRFEKLQQENGYLRARIVADDSNSRDNQAYELLEGVGERRVLLVTQQNSFLERALSLEDTITLEKANSVKNIDAAKMYDFIVYDGVAPKKIYHEENILLINPPDEVELAGEVLAKRKKTFQNASLQIPQGSLTDGLDSFATACSKGVTYQSPLWSYSFINYGEESVAYFGRVKGRVIAVMGFDLHDSDLPLQMEFPILMQGILEQGEQSGSLDVSHCQPGESVRMHFTGDEKGSVTWKTPDGETVSGDVGQERAVFTRTSRAGLYPVTWQQDNQTVERYFVVDYPESESVCKAGIHVTRDGKESVKAVTDIRKIYGKWSLLRPVIVLLLILLSIEWVVYRNRL